MKHLRIVEKPVTVKTPPEAHDQCTHPDVLKRGKQYVMAYTPYPLGSRAHERPCIAVGKVPDHFETVSQAYQNNMNLTGSDPDLVCIDNTFLLYSRNRETGQPFWRVSVKYSADLKNWSEEYVCSGIHNFLSPSVIYESIVPNEHTFCAWGIDEDSFQLKYAESSDGLNWNATKYCRSHSSVLCKLDFIPSKLIPWHVDVQKIRDNQYYALILFCGKKGGQPPSALHLVRSTDGIDWNVEPTPLLTPRLWFDRLVYRGCLLIESDKIHVWFGGQNHAGEWHIGYGEIHE